MKVVLFDLAVAAASIRQELYGQENISCRIVARQTLWSLLSSFGLSGWFDAVISVPTRLYLRRKK